MRLDEINMLKDGEFIRRLLLYTHPSSERIATAWEDTNPESYNRTKDKLWTTNFEAICNAIMNNEND